MRILRRVDARDLITEALEAANRRDLDAVVALTDEEFEGIVPASMSAEPDRYVGHEGIRNYWLSFWEIVDELVIQPQEFDEVGEWTIARCHATGRGRTSGLPIDNYIAVACRLRDGRVYRFHAFPDLDEARSALA